MNKSIYEPFKTATEMARQVRVSTVLNSLLWILPFLLIALVVVSFAGNVVVQKFLMYLIAAVVAVFLLSFIGILIFGDSNLLRSEKHVFNMRMLDMLGDQSRTFEDFKNSLQQTNPAQPDPKDAIATNSGDIKFIKQSNHD